MTSINIFDPSRPICPLLFKLFGELIRVICHTFLATMFVHLHTWKMLQTHC